MSWIASVAQIGMTVVGGALKASGGNKGAITEARQAQQQAQADQEQAIATNEEKLYEAEQLNYQAGQTRATAQRAARDEIRKERILQSRAIALAADSGGAVSSPDLVNLIGGIEGEGEYRALTALYEGGTAARGQELMAEARKREGADALKAAGIAAKGYITAGKAAISAGHTAMSSTLLGTAGTVAKQGYSLYSAYGGGSTGSTGSTGTYNSTFTGGG